VLIRTRVTASIGVAVLVLLLPVTRAQQRQQGTTERSRVTPPSVTLEVQLQSGETSAWGTSLTLGAPQKLRL
jgi:hypothetical protein